MNQCESVTRLYLNARQWLADTGFSEEIEWQKSLCPESVSETTFLAEAAWVIYNSGFRESVVRRHFNFLSLCFCDWASAKEIVAAGANCVEAAMLALANRRKHEAVLEIARRIEKDGFQTFRGRLFKELLPNLQQLPFIGPVTALHLAKNLGFDVAKPDRHLVRLQQKLGFQNVAAMCEHVSSVTGDPIGVVDLILWRFLERTASQTSARKCESLSRGIVEQRYATA